MGFWSWLFGYGKKEELDKESIEVIPIDANIEVKEPKVNIRKPAYKSRPLTREDAQFVQDMTSKASRPDPKVTPFMDRTNPQDIERITNQLKDRLAKKR